MSIPAEAYRIRSTIISVDKGLHIFRYESAADEESPPFFIIAPIPSDVEALEYMSDNLSGGNLCKPGDYLIIKAKRPIKIITTKGVYGALGKDHVELSFMPLNPHSRKPSQPLLPAGQPVNALPSSSPDTQSKVEYVNLDAKPGPQPYRTAASTTRGSENVRDRAKDLDVEQEAAIPSLVSAAIKCSVRTSGVDEPHVCSASELPSEFPGAVKAIAFANTERSNTNGINLRLTVQYSDGRKAVYEGRDVAATALGMTTIAGVRLQALPTGGGAAEEVLSRLFGVADVTPGKGVNATQQKLVRRRVGVVMDL